MNIMALQGSVVEFPHYCYVVGACTNTEVVVHLLISQFTCMYELFD